MPALKVGDRVLYQNEPCWVIGFYRNKTGGYVYIERADRSHTLVRNSDLRVIEEGSRR